MEKGFNTNFAKIVTDLQNIHDELEEAKDNNRQILDALDDGIFFLNSELLIQNDYSIILEEIITQTKLANRYFFELLENRVPDKAIEDVKEFLKLMFQEDHDENTIYELNPLLNIEFHLVEESGLWQSSKYLSFKFKRIIRNSKIDKLVCLVKDVSSQNELAQKLEEFEKQSEKQKDWLICLIHIELPLLNEFINVVDYKLKVIDETLRSPLKPGDYSAAFQKIFQSIHHIYSNAAILDLQFFTERACLFKNEIEDLKNKQDLKGDDFVPVVIQLSKMQQMVREIKELMKLIKGLDRSLRTTRRFDAGLLIRSIENLIQSLSETSGKIIRFNYHNFKSLSIPFAYQNIVREFLIVLTRFSVEFWIEKAEERISVNLNPKAIIELETFLQNKIFGIKFRHNGRLMRTERLLQKSVEQDDINTIDPKNAEESFDPGTEALRIFFNPDISSADSSGTTESVQIIKDFDTVKKKLKMHGGRIKVTFTSEDFCEYTITFPHGNI